MALESFSGIWSLNTSNPASTDDQSQGDDHIRGIKRTIRETWPNISATVNTTQSELNTLLGATGVIETRLGAVSASISTQIGYGSMYISGNSTEVSATTSLSTFVGWAVPGPAKLMTLSTASGHVTVANPGIYSVGANLCISSSAAVLVTVALFIGSNASNAQSKLKLAASGQGVVSINGDVSAGTSDQIALRLMADSTTSIKVTDGQMVVKRNG